MAEHAPPVAVAPVGYFFLRIHISFSLNHVRGTKLLWFSEEEGRRHRIAFNSLYLFSFRSINYEANGEELYNFTHGVTLSWISQYAAASFCLFSPPTRDSHPGGVASMTRDRGYPDWLVLSARLLVQPSCGQVKIVQNIYVWSCSLVAMWRYYSLLLYVLLFS